MSSLVDPMTRDNLANNIIAHDMILLSRSHHDFLHTMLCIMESINSIKDLYQLNI